MAEDPRVDAARYRVERLKREIEETGESRPEPPPPEPDRAPGTPTAHDRALYVETVIRQAIRRGDFDDLAGAGRPLPELGASHDPDWWIRRKIRDEGLTGLGPPALRLRVEHAEFERHIDGMTREADVRDYTADFTRRVVEARRQLQGGPPVVTPTRDPEVEVAAWRERRAARAASAASAPMPEPFRRRRWWRRR